MRLQIHSARSGCYDSSFETRVSSLYVGYDPFLCTTPLKFDALRIG